MPQTPQRRMYLYWKSLKRSREYQYGLRKGWYSSRYMMVAKRFGIPVREVRDIIDSQREPRT
ncbi:hypothetical protein [Streptomyces sp. DSM 41534]